MRQFVLSALIFGISFSAEAGDLPKPLHRCTGVHVSGSAWLPVTHGDAVVEGLFYAQTNCPAGYSPVSGGIRFEGVWANPGYAKDWREVVSTPFDETERQEAVAWRCMVLATDASKKLRPDPLWCTAVCCRWD